MEFAKKMMEMLNEGLDNMGPQIGSELARLGRQGTMEAASGLMTGNFFVPYGPGAYAKDVEGIDKDGAQIEAPQVELEQEQSRGR